MRRHLTYCLLSLILGALMWPILLVWPFTGNILISPAYLHASKTWAIQIAAMSLAGLFAALLLRKKIYQANGLTEMGLTSVMVILICAFFFGILFATGSEFVGFLKTGLFPSASEGLTVLILGSLACGVMGLAFGFVSLLIMVPAGMCGIYLLKRVLGRKMIEKTDEAEP